MSAAASLLRDSASLRPWAAGEGVVVLRGVPWTAYVALNDAVEQKNVKVSYFRGELELMTRGPRHEVNKKFLARLFELWALERDVQIQGYGETTLRTELALAGIEPDECYVVGGPREGTPTPDLAIEVVVTRGALDKLPIYRALGVREVWIVEAGRIAVHRLGQRGYVAAGTSRLFPSLDVAALARHAAAPDQHTALKAFRAELQGRPAAVGKKRRPPR